MEGLSPAAAKNAEYLLEEQRLPAEAVHALKPLLEAQQGVDLRATLPATLAVLHGALGAGAGAELLPPVSLAQLAAHAPLVLLSAPEAVLQRLEFLERLEGGGSRVVQQARGQLSLAVPQLPGALGVDGEPAAAAAPGLADAGDCEGVSGSSSGSGSGSWDQGGDGRSMVDQLARLKAILATMREQHAARQRAS